MGAGFRTNRAVAEREGEKEGLEDQAGTCGGWSAQSVCGDNHLRGAWRQGGGGEGGRLWDAWMQRGGGERGRDRGVKGSGRHMRTALSCAQGNAPQLRCTLTNKPTQCTARHAHAGAGANRATASCNV